MSYISVVRAMEIRHPERNAPTPSQEVQAGCASILQAFHALALESRIWNFMREVEGTPVTNGTGTRRYIRATMSRLDTQEVRVLTSEVAAGTAPLRPQSQVLVQNLPTCS